MGKLTLVATPIGNLEDFSPRGLQVLRQADVIAAEDTRHSGLFLRHFGIKKPFISYYQHNCKQRESLLLDRLAAGENIALLTDAGTPGISDPGWEIVDAALRAGYEVDAVPGPCALINALVLSGLPTERFVFEGFLPRGKDCAAALAKLRREERTLIFYEAPHRLRETAQHLAEAFGEERQAAFCREMTKKFQEVRRGSLGELCAYFAQQEPKGEFCLVVAGAPPDQQQGPALQDVLAEANRLIAAGMKQKAAAKEVALRYQLSANEIYRLLLAKNES